MPIICLGAYTTSLVFLVGLITEGAYSRRRGGLLLSVILKLNRFAGSDTNRQIGP